MNRYGYQGVVLRIPASLRARAATMANEESLSLNLFIASAVAEKINRLEQESHAKARLGSTAVMHSVHEDALLYG